MSTHTNKQLAAHISRIEGQLAAARKALATDDCSKTARTLLAASRSLASLRAACMSEFLSKKVYQGATPKDKKLYDDVQSLMRA
jgi:DNA-binding FrmR family transcriptional regulator